MLEIEQLCNEKEIQKAEDNLKSAVNRYNAEIRTKVIEYLLKKVRDYEGGEVKSENLEQEET